MNVAVVMPAFNEEEGIVEFMREILEAFAGHEARVVVVDDSSTDRTAALVEDAAQQGFPATVLRNVQNMGHGPSTLRALAAGVAAEADIIIAVDGDGQFHGSDIAQIAVALDTSGSDLVEGVRTGRNDPGYRRVVSALTRILVRSACGVAPRDANTPLRAYRRSRLIELLEMIPSDAMTPNLLTSAIARRDSWHLLEIPVSSLARRGSSTVGSTWGASMAALPSKHFVRFCWKSLKQWRRLRAVRA